MKYTFSILLLTISAYGVWAQKDKDALADTTKHDKSKFIPTGVRIGVDAISIFRSQYEDSFSGWEGNADIDFSRFYFALDVGNWKRDFKTAADVYSNDGTYFRVGADVNFLTKDPEKNMFFLGLRYGRSKFSESLSIQRTDSLWNNNPINEQYHNSNISAGWLELTTGIRVRIYKIFWMGYTARFKFGLNTNEKGNLVPHDVPGYGRTDKDTAWGFNYQLFVRIPVRKQK